MIAFRSESGQNGGASAGDQIIASVTIRNLSAETKELLARRAARHKRSLEEELRQILDASARADAENPDMQEPFGDWLVRITRPGYQDVADFIDAQRKSPDRPPVTFE